ncbi:uncharacterized protein DUF397 [Streptomyces sp. CEV 2-1]|uniref:DUF397 domain-containing protein n=1 Tax=Streptomyces sp. CEV 2-1 TaxID=2485153 RepID=UPI000F4A7B49|nr:DUF397 domain-containing protein [Streptomyces sp. CEV 2-1]ROQ80619.1 uncharacterized protein DUF397 [Streptomyces sp. CEV 2-1]
MSIAPDLSAAAWRKSSYSDGSGGSCVEVVDGVAGVVPIRDSKISGGAVLIVADDGWSSFVTAVKRGSMGPR